MKKYLIPALLPLLVLLFVSGYSLDVSAEEENEDPYKDFIMDELFRDEDDDINYLNSNEAVLYSVTVENNNICSVYSGLSSYQKEYADRTVSQISGENINLVYYDTSARKLYAFVGASVLSPDSNNECSIGFFSNYNYKGRYEIKSSSSGSATTAFSNKLDLDEDIIFYYEGNSNVDYHEFIYDGVCVVKNYSVTVSAGSGGSVNDVSGSYVAGSSLTLIATPNQNYKFVEWSDGSTENPRTITVKSDMFISAIFEEIPKYSIDVSSIGNGSVYGAGEYYEGTEIVLTAVPDEGYYFVRWSDNTTDILKTVVVNGDISLTAYFEKYEPSACRFSTQLLEDDHIFNLIKSVQQSFDYGNQVWSDWVIYHKFVYLTWETQLEPFSYDIKYPVLEYYEIQSLNDTSYYLRSDVKREYGYVTVYTANWVWSDYEDDVVVDSYTRDTYELIPDIPLSFTDRDGTVYKLSPVTVSNMVMTKTCFGEGYDDGQMQSMQYGVLSQILSFLQNKLTGLGNEQEITNQKLDNQIQIQEQQNSLVIEQNNKMDTQNQLIQDQFSVNTDDDFGVQGLTAVAGEKMGVLSFLGESTYILLDVFDPAGVPDPVLEFPAFSLNISGEDYKVWDSVGFDFTVLDSYLGGFMDVVRSVTTLMVWLAVINYCIREFEKFWRS